MVFELINSYLFFSLGVEQKEGNAWSARHCGWLHPI
jgi:hypothetical protein